jgi:site-specific DNA-methyltransferase (adenine-specific)
MYALYFVDVKDKKSKFTFNYQLLKKLNNNKQMKNVWRFAVCSGKERLKDEFGNKLHSTQKPIDLIKRIVIMSTNCGDLILDPFMGTGTTAQAAIELNRDFVGIDYIEKYNRAAEERIKSVEIDKELLNLEKIVIEQIETSKKRLSIVEIVENGLLKAGDILTFYYSPTKKSDIKVPLLNNGKVLYENSIFSIHQLGKVFLQTPSCNGYKHWYYTNNNGQDESIENLRR